jgi:L-threonylcarbamoyladenylate synthase
VQTLSLSEIPLEDVLEITASVLEGGGILAYPTESYYALGVIATDPEAVRKLFAIKQRPGDKPLPVIVGNMTVLEGIVLSVPDRARNLMEKYWPGALTIIFKAGDAVAAQATGGTGTVAVRIPGASFALQMVQRISVPVTATSANMSSMPPASNAGMVRKYFGTELDLLIDGGDSPGGEPSTIVDATVSPCRIVRQGSLRLP